MDAKLIFAPLIRVSTESQEKQGQSLRTQKEQLTLAIESLGGTVYKWYEGQEHSTSDFERHILEELMADAQAGKFNAVMVADLSRWSRDNGRSKQDTRTLQDLGIRFFEGTREINLFDPTQAFVLGMGVEVAEFFASQQSYKSVINRIGRARQGYPCCTLPYGRTFDKTTRTWGIIPEAKARVEQVAELYLGGGYSWRTLGEKFGMNYANLCSILRTKCGDNWDQHFVSKRHGISVTVPTPVPRLLDEATIQAIRQRSDDKATWDKTVQKTEYLFSKLIFDKESGRALTGTQNSKGVRYYKPYLNSEINRYAINADALEQTVLTELFEVLSSKESLRAAVFSGSPIAKVADRLQAELTGKQGELARVEKNVENLLTLIENADDVATLIAKVKPKLTTLEARGVQLKDEIGLLNHRLSALPTDQEIERGRRKWAGTLQAVQESYLTSGAALANLSFTDLRRIVGLIFGGKDESGRRYGIYITCLGGSPRRYKFECYGRLGSLHGKVWSRTGKGLAAPDKAMQTGDNPALSDQISTVIDGESLCSTYSCLTPPPQSPSTKTPIPASRPTS